MRFVIITIWMCVSTFVHGQQVDTISVLKQVDSLVEISRKYILSNDFDNANKIASLAEQLAIERLGKNSISYGNVCFIKGKLHYSKGELKETEKCYLEYSSILEQMSGEDNMDYAWSLDDLGQLYDVMGLFEKAEPLFIKSGLIIAQLRGKNHPDYAWSLNDLAIMYRNMGAYEKAEPLYLEAKSIRENALGKNHPDYVWSLNNLANLYNFMGVYEKAEPYYLTSINLWEKLDGKESTNYATGINNLASLYFNMGVFDKAEPLIIESCTLRGKLLGKQSVDYAGSLNNLASLYLKTGQYQKAEPLFIEALTLREKIFGKVHAEVANSIGNLGLLHENMGNYEKAESLFLDAKSIWEQTTGVDHPEYAASVFNLAHFYLKSNQIIQAEPLILSALTIREKLLGKEHPDFLESQRLLSKLYVLQGRIHEATTLLEAVYRQQETELLKATKYLSEYELSQFIDAYQNQEDELCAYNYSCTTNSNSSVLNPLAMIAYDRALFYKGFLLTSAIRLRNLAESTEASKAIYIRLKSYHRRLASEYALPINERTEVAELEDSANAIEKELVYTVSGYSKNVQQLKWQEVKKALQKNEAAIEFVRFEFNFPKSTDSIMYVALLIKENASAPFLISMCEEKSLDSLLLSKSERKADYVNSLYSLSDRGAIAIEAPKKSLYEMLWKPLEKELVGIKTIYFSPSGLLHRINLDAIPISETETLADKYQLIELGSTRQIVVPTQIKNVNNDAVLFGGIQFEQDTAIQNNEPLIASRSRGELSFNSIDSTLRGGSWNYLAGTEREVNAIEKMMQSAGLKTNLKKGYNATEEAFKNIGANNSNAPRILHIATHGYFFPDAKESRQSSVVSRQEEPIFKMSEHPMLRSGLIMAGGNAAWLGKQSLEGREDGILTAYEISQMNLSNTELVVLSACETGLGDIQGNEGVYGLQRAFKIAGAKYLIMSLWQVPDKQTSFLMTTFYKKWLEDKMMIPEAFHAAQKELRDNGLDPYNWAGFVLVE